MHSKRAPDVYVSSDDKEILAIAGQIGAKTINRNPEIAQDATTLDPVIYDAYVQAEKLEQKTYDLIVTLQPTSPLLKSASLDAAIEIMASRPEIDTVIAAKDDTHLTWKYEEGGYKPNYVQRVNRQYLTPVYKETGGFLITRASVISESNRIGNRAELFLLDNGEDIDIDTYEDWNLCEYYLKRKRILFVVSGHREIGLGHVYNTLLIANDILNHQIEFLVDRKSALAREKIASKNYTVHMQEHDDIVDDIRRCAPDVVINDRLDTDGSYIKALKALGAKVINFEDLGSGAKEADLVINAIYPEKEVLPRHYFGHEYFVLRDEFILARPRKIARTVSRILLTFGGVDPNNYTRKVLESIYGFCQERKIAISVVAGFGYTGYETLEAFEEIEIYRNANDIANHMKEANIIFTSAGRTTYEIASLNVPAIVMAQNEREMTHFFASEEYGFVNLGLGYNVSNEEILQVFSNLVGNDESRRYMSELMARMDLASGRQRTLKLINDIVEDA